MDDARVQLVEAVLDDLVNGSKEDFAPGTVDFLRTLLNNFAVGVVQDVAPTDEAARAEVFDKARQLAIRVEPNEGNPWVQMDLRILRERIERGQVAFEIARVLDRGVKEVDEKMREHG